MEATLDYNNDVDDDDACHTKTCRQFGNSGHSLFAQKESRKRTGPGRSHAAHGVHSKVSRKGSNDAGIGARDGVAIGITGLDEPSTDNRDDTKRLE